MLREINVLRLFSYNLLLVSDKFVSLEMYPTPAVAGERLTLRCLVWGTDQITRTVFLKNNATIEENNPPTYKIDNVTESVEGAYKCWATYRYGTAEVLNDQVSDPQDLLVQGMYVQTPSECLFLIVFFRHILKSVSFFVLFQWFP